ncbi:uncharacterized protein LOC124697536 [Lolium rigidum]|uniref:uncharacterized protein LOC124697536 n=1 Tax=Lolium rigidum TaxID=89674 RepID=UPI001F5DE23D|nr:uncharacterized protein LOC124697536 [Lolium rigidum]
MSRGNKLRWLWRAPVRALGRARDYYVRSITGCSRYVPADAAFGAYPVHVPVALPRSRSCGAGEDDLRDLIRASSRRRERDDQRRQVVQAVARSQSTAVGRSMAPIDEDAPCEFGGGGVGELYYRSQSYAGGAAGGAAGRPRFHKKEAVLG